MQPATKKKEDGPHRNLSPKSRILRAHDTRVAGLWRYVSRVHSVLGLRRSRLMLDRRFLASSRRRCDARVGLVARRGTGGMIASRIISARRLRAAARLRCCNRCSAEVTVRTPSANREDSRSRTRARWISLSAVVVEISRLNWTRESDVLTPCPPGPPECENRSVSSEAGIVIPRGAPGPGGTCKSSMPLSLPHARADREYLRDSQFHNDVVSYVVSPSWQQLSDLVGRRAP